VTVILDWDNDPDNWTRPRSPVKCSFCGERVRLPFVHWDCWGARKASIAICAHCCRWVRHGLAADMMRATAIAEGASQMQAPPSELGQA
jgi:hypothetical protein